jgi:hypothetical protein
VTPRSKNIFPISAEAEEEENPQGHAGWINKDCCEDPVEESTMASPKDLTATSKSDKFSFAFSLVHGDILVLFGDQFEVGKLTTFTVCLRLSTLSHSIRSHGMELRSVSSTGRFLWHFVDYGV